MIKQSYYRLASAGLLFLFILTSCGGAKKESKPVAPAVMSNPAKESGLNTITLTANAVKRIGITVIRTNESNVSNSRMYSGEVMAIPGQTITLSAPIAGTLMAARNGRAPQAGQKITKGQPVYRLLILPSEKDMISAKEDVVQRQVQFEVAVQKLQRAEQLLKEKAGSLRAKQEAEAELAGITASLRVARARLELLKGNTSNETADRLSTLNIEAPITGTIQKVYSSTEQVVAAATPIADITATNNLWVRVPVYAGDMDKIDRQALASVQLLSGFAGSGKTVTGHPVKGPETADPLNTSVDLYYQVTNSEGEFRPGSKLTVVIPFIGKMTGLTIPYSAVLYDIHGGTWVYENTSDTIFVRKRIEIDHVENNQAVIKRGLKGGENIVITGAAELFGTEFGGGK